MGGCHGSSNSNYVDCQSEASSPPRWRLTYRASLPATLRFLRPNWEMFLARAVGESRPEVGIARSPQGFVPDDSRASLASMPNRADRPLAMFWTDTFDCGVRTGVWTPIDESTPLPRPSTDVGGP